MKSTKTYPLITLLDLYLIPKDPKFVPHLAIIPIKYDLISRACKGCSVKTYIVWAWK